MSDKVFVDTNVFVYAYTDNNRKKHETAKSYLRDESNLLVISAQILSEIYSTFNKYQVAHDDITPIIDEVSNLCEVCPVGIKTIKAALDLRGRYGLNYWDCLFLASALESGCRRVFTEDLQDGQMIEGFLKIENIFTKI
jgi:predicted nucleic acid-binding protein